jgi:hypothetical protein
MAKVLPVSRDELEVRIESVGREFGMSGAEAVEAYEAEELEETDELLYAVLANAALKRVSPGEGVLA